MNQSDAAFGPRPAKKGSGNQASKQNAPERPAKEAESQPQTSYFREGGFQYGSDENCSGIRVPEGTVVRVLASHAMDRESDFMTGLGLKLDNRR